MKEMIPPTVSRDAWVELPWGTSHSQYDLDNKSIRVSWDKEEVYY